MNKFLRDCLRHINPFARDEDIVEAIMLNEYDVLFVFKNGNKVVYDSFEQTFTSIRYGSNDLTDEQYKKEFSVILRKIMNRKHVNQEELARRVGTTQPMISRYINGDAMPSFTMMIKLAKALDCSTDDFYYKYF
jgi:DNA-binding XRE family transcriptional regulator